MYWQFGFLALAVICDAFMDWIMFQTYPNTGFWSLHWNDTNDAWHWTKRLKWLFICVAIFPPNLFYLVLAAILIWLCHEVFYHLIFKKGLK